MNNIKYESNQVKKSPNLKSGFLDNTDSLYNMISKLKQVKRKLLTNCYIDESQLAEAICKGKAVYEYNENNYLNLLIREDEFSRLYFYIVDIGTWEFHGNENTYVCDIFFRKENQLLDKFAKLICQKGFTPYAAFHKWTCKAPSKISTPNNNTVFVQHETDEAIKILFQCFDKYTDFLPRKDDLQLFFKEKRFICVYDTINDEFLGALIYTEKELVITEEFLFVKKKKRGQKISNLLHEYLYSLHSHKKMQYIAWIRDDNIQSIALHQNYNYQKQEMKKITLKRG